MSGHDIARQLTLLFFKKKNPPLWRSPKTYYSRSLCFFMVRQLSSEGEADVNRGSEKVLPQGQTNWFKYRVFNIIFSHVYLFFCPTNNISSISIQFFFRSRKYKNSSKKANFSFKLNREQGESFLRVPAASSSIHGL